MNPLLHLKNLFSWTILRVFWYFTQFIQIPLVNSKIHVDEDAPDPPPPPKEVHYPYSCDKKKTLYVMDQKLAARGITNSSQFCSRPFYSQRVIIFIISHSKLYSLLKHFSLQIIYFRSRILIYCSLRLIHCIRVVMLDWKFYLCQYLHLSIPFMKQIEHV